MFCKVVINARGSREGLPQEMVAFLDYLIENKTDSSLTDSLEREVDNAKYRNEWEVEYMTLQMIKKEEYEEGRSEGRNNIISAILDARSGMTYEELVAKYGEEDATSAMQLK